MDQEAQVKASRMYLVDVKATAEDVRRIAEAGYNEIVLVSGFSNIRAVEFTPPLLVGTDWSPQDHALLHAEGAD